MKISYNWLKSYINIDKSPTELADILTNTGLEVEKVEQFESVKGGLEGFVVGKVLSKEKHPNADKLSLTKVDIGTGDILSIVCGAPNVAAGQNVIVAVLGTTIYHSEGNFTIKKSKIRGEDSEGMLCSEVELGLGNNHDGILVLDDNIKAGTLAKDVFEVEKDTIFEIGLTPNRTDAMSHIGVARDIVAALNVNNTENQHIQLPKITLPTVQSSTKKIEVNIENTEACPRYSSVLIDDVKVAPSPKWLQNRLKSIGLKPINNVVDITNFVLKEFGQPLHAFDADAIKGNKVIVKTLTDQTPFVCLDSKEIKLKATDLMICNAEEGMCIAGVFGGESSGVKEHTKTIFLESAYFNPQYIRKTSTKHQLHTDAASRYEKGGDPNITVLALQRAAELICEISGGKLISSVSDIYPNPISDTSLFLRYEKIDNLIGKKIARDILKQILIDLDIKIEQENEQGLQLLVPPYRVDVLREVDVIEEILRIYGYNQIAILQAVYSTLSFNNGIDPVKLKDTIADKLNGFGFSEIMTNSISKSVYYTAEELAQVVHLQNSMTAELDIMRNNMLYDGLDVLAHNINRKNAHLSLFEFGHIYTADLKQHEKLVFYQTGNNQAQNWLQKVEKTNFFHLKNTVLAILKSLKIVQLEVEEASYKDWEFGLLLRLNQKVIGYICKVNQNVLQHQNIKQDVFYAELDWDLMLKIHKKSNLKYTAVSKFPEVNRDLAIVLNEEIAFDTLKNTIFKTSKQFVTEIQLFDIYRDIEKIGENKKSYAISLTFRDKEKTLTDNEIDKLVNEIINTLQKELDANIRG